MAESFEKKLADTVIARREDIFLEWCKLEGIGQYSPYRFCWWLESEYPELFEQTKKELEAK